jgi:uncharacterized membrane protein
MKYEQAHKVWRDIGFLLDTYTSTNDAFLTDDFIENVTCQIHERAWQLVNVTRPEEDES